MTNRYSDWIATPGTDEAGWYSSPPTPGTTVYVRFDDEYPGLYFYIKGETDPVGWCENIYEIGSFFIDHKGKYNFVFDENTEQVKQAVDDSVKVVAARRRGRR